MFGAYSIVFFIIRRFGKSKAHLNEFDNSAIQLTFWVAALWILLRLLAIVLFFIDQKAKMQSEPFLQHVSWFIGSIWFQFLIWVILIFLLRHKFVKRYLIPRVVIAFLLAFSFDKISMLLMYFHRDYLPPIEAFPSFNILDFITRLFLNVVLFILMVSLFHFGKQKLNKVAS